ncbi:arylsulfatase [Ruania alkalisoli]|uniref:Arylsulfatase n=1 Tax=Ruania alkalisoli TaxID=2779775 RepID=A0A7M1SSX9_9MICO|nr:arylsulfatase [Ruania alkalisoli]QOR70669.1 arylsulfatase [Ruania alkalisoli]
MTTPPLRRSPNIVVILADDLGYSDIGCYGSEIRTPRLDALAAAGVRMSQFYNTARCSPARASLLTGLHPHQTGIGVLTQDDGPLGYPGTLNHRCVTMAEILRDHGYATAMFGKWHLSGDVQHPNDAWPTRRGFDTFYGTLGGAASYYQPVTLTRGESVEPVPTDGFYLTSVLGDEAAAFVRRHTANQPDTPFFCYLPFTAPHWPLHAPPEAIDGYRGFYDKGWDLLRERRYRRLVAEGLISGDCPLTDRDADVTAWADTAHREWQALRMQVYAAQVELMDAAIGSVIDAITEAGQLDDTLILFLSDNGGCAEAFQPAWVDEMDRRPLAALERTSSGERVRLGNDPSIPPGPPETFTSYGKPWANLSNTPFREYKHWVHEGGIATPFIAHWPSGGLRQRIDHTPHYLPDVLPTVLDVVGATYPDRYSGRDILPLEGISMIGSWTGSEPMRQRSMFFEHEGNGAVRSGRWKLVRKYGQGWELYDLNVDRTEVHDLAAHYPDRVRTMSEAWHTWTERCGVKPWAPLHAARAARRDTAEQIRTSPLRA